MEKNKKQVLVMVFSIIALLVIVGGATYAYFQAQAGGGASTDINLITGTTDSLTFIEGDGINLKVTMANFSQGAGNPSDDTTPSVSLIANNKDNEATATYNVYFIIDSNNFEYTTSDNQTELLLKVTDPNGNPITSITGLAYNSELGGFDITTRTGGFLVSADYEITASLASGSTGPATAKQDWNFEVQMVNLDTPQDGNKGKVLTGRVFLTTDQEATYATAVTNTFENTSVTYNSYTGTLSVTQGSADIDGYYFGYEQKVSTSAMNESKVLRLGNMLASAETVSYVKSESPTYTFTNLSPNTTYTIYAYTEDKYGFKSNIYETEITTTPYDLPVIDTVSLTSTLNTVTAVVSATKGSEEIVKYLYTIDDGKNWVEKADASHTFEGLADTATYTVRVKAVDTNGEESIEWHDTINTVTYDLPTISTATATTTYNSITVNTTAQGGTNNISKYYYSIDGGAYVEGSSSYTFTGLEESKQYAIKVKVEDTAERESVEYELNASTIAYVSPKVTATTSATNDTLTITASGTNGTGTITTYYYSKDNGSNWETSTNSSYTFTGLTPGATYPIAVKVMDNNGRESSLFTTSQATTYTSPSVTATATVTSNSITVTAKGTNGSGAISTYYYSINNGAYTSSSSNTHTFGSLSGGTTYTIKVKVSDVNNKESEVYSFTATTEVGSLAAYIKALYTSDGTNGLYYHDGSGTYGTSEAGDKSYRYTGANPANYVCFGSTADSCPTENLYRIIGVFGDQVKLIKYDFATNTMLGTSTYSGNDYAKSSYANYQGALSAIPRHYWSGSSSNSSNAWASSTLNTSALNSTYISYLGTTWANKIATTSWKVGGNTYANVAQSNAKTAYTNEITSPAEGTTYSGKIGLMYVSDYMYAADPTYWSYKGVDTATTDYRAAINANWMYSGVYEWTISRRSDTTNYAFIVTYTGCVSNTVVHDNLGVRPVFYLTSSTAYAGGSGTAGAPYRVN